MCIILWRKQSVWRQHAGHSRKHHKTAWTPFSGYISLELGRDLVCSWRRCWFDIKKYCIGERPVGGATDIRPPVRDISRGVSEELHLMVLGHTSLAIEEIHRVSSNSKVTDCVYIGGFVSPSSCLNVHKGPPAFGDRTSFLAGSTAPVGSGVVGKVAVRRHSHYI